MTKITIPTKMVQGIPDDFDINAWFGARGGTVIQRERSRREWIITIQETLNQTQKDNLKAQLDAILDPGIVIE